MARDVVTGSQQHNTITACVATISRRLARTRSWRRCAPTADSGDSGQDLVIKTTLHPYHEAASWHCTTQPEPRNDVDMNYSISPIGCWAVPHMYFQSPVNFNSRLFENRAPATELRRLQRVARQFSGCSVEAAVPRARGYGSFMHLF